ncbi:unnamed protein product [Miscanthus lutarioriparius]|uniref:SET domain-containing protein n=1 Tax=Miscanthus lutarioriparius TaxID=422564 RepID=A0A811M7Q3_9POAL|nr:unnamed protein product [Miscanthus lutarioriparius]
MAIKGVAASREDWREYVAVCSRIIDAASSGHDRRVLCSTLAHRADARARLGDAACWLADCDAALAAEPAHPGALLSKGALLSGLGRYAAADEARELAEQCRRLEAQARSGAVDLSEWVLAGFAGKFPDLAEYVGSVEVLRSPHGCRGFRCEERRVGGYFGNRQGGGDRERVIPDAADSDEKMFVWKDFVDKVLEAAEKCPKSAALIYTLSTGEERQDEFVVPDMAIFKNETEGDSLSDGTSAARAMGTQEAVHVDRILKVLDVNCLTEDAPAADVLGNNGVVNCGVGLWVLPSFINHSCHPNARRTHIGDHAIVHASRDIKAGEEITFPYFDVLVPVSKRREASRAWGFECKCDRCRFEAEDSILRQEILKSENDLASGGDIGAVVVWLEEKTRKSMVKAFLRASFWSTYSALYDSDKLMRKRGRRVPSEALVAESVADAVGGNESVLKAMLRGSRDGNGCGNRLEVEDKVVTIGRATYCKLVKRHAMRDLFRLTLDATNKINI